MECQSRGGGVGGSGTFTTGSCVVDRVFRFFFLPNIIDNLSCIGRYMSSLMLLRIRTPQWAIFVSDREGDSYCNCRGKVGRSLDADNAY